MISYDAIVDRVHDGDTFHAAIMVPAVGFGLITVIQSEIRLAGINAPELIGSSVALGQAATIGLMGLLGFTPKPKRTRQIFNIPGYYLTDSPLHLTLLIDPLKEREKYGRVLATPVVNGIDICAAMVTDGYAIAVKYGLEEM